MSLASAASIQRSQQPPTSTPDTMATHDSAPPEDSKSKKRTLFGLGKKKPTLGEKSSSAATAESDASSPPQTTRDASQASSARMSPTPAEGVHIMPSTPGRNMYSSSPHIGSPAGSQIFERDVQESAAAMPNSPAIPSHIQTENHIPPVLDASSEAITDEQLNPDAVEIVTHTSHQPAALTVTGAGPSDSMSNSWAEDMASVTDKDETASNYGSLDSNDVRRLSFISFADVVQAEQGPAPGASRESIHMAGMTSLAAMSVNRSPSPIRSPISSQGAEASPPTSNPGSIKGLNASPGRKPLGSPTSTEHNLGGGELNVETMSQALRRTGSTDLSVARSTPVSPIEGPSR